MISVSDITEAFRVAPGEDGEGERLLRLGALILLTLETILVITGIICGLIS